MARAVRVGEAAHHEHLAADGGGEGVRPRDALACPRAPREPPPPLRRRLPAPGRRRAGRARAAAPDRGVREIPLESITGTLEPHRAEQFDPAFRPAAIVRERWQRVWLAEARGAVLPPISVVPAGDGFAVRDGHHRVSVALARGAVTIDAVVSAG